MRTEYHWRIDIVDQKSGRIRRRRWYSTKKQVELAIKDFKEDYTRGARPGELLLKLYRTEVDWWLTDAVSS